MAVKTDPRHNLGTYIVVQNLNKSKFTYDIQQTDFG